MSVFWFGVDTFWFCTWTLRGFGLRRDYPMQRKETQSLNNQTALLRAAWIPWGSKYICIYVCICVCVHIYVCMYTYTCIVRERERGKDNGYVGT